MSFEGAREIHSTTIPEWLVRQARSRGSHLALSVPSCHGWRERLSYGQLAERMETMARGLQARGVSRGARVALLLTNSAAREAVLTALGCWRLGAVVAPLNPAYSADELQHAIRLVQPSLLVVADAPSAHRAAAAGIPTERILPLQGAEDERQAWPDPDVERRVPADALPPLAEASWTDVSTLVFTSGTTARAKAVMYSHRSQLFTGEVVGRALGLDDNDVYHVAAPIYTSSFLGLACMAAWARGAAAVFEADRLDNEARLELLAAERATVFHAVPAIIGFMLDVFDARRHRIESLHTVAYGGAVMPVELILRLEQAWPRMRKVQVWGMTETGPAGTVLPHWMLPRKIGAIGVPMPGCAMRIVDEHDEGRLVDRAVGEIGEMAFGGPSSALGYLDNEEATRKTFVEGWVRTGDLGYRDIEGVVFFVDRKKDIINRGGLKIASAAIEEAVLRCPAVREAAAVAIPHPKLGEDIGVCVVLHEGADVSTEELARICSTSLSAHMVPRHWYFLHELPRNGLGKVLKRVLRDRIVSGELK